MAGHLWYQDKTLSRELEFKADMMNGSLIVVDHVEVVQDTGSLYSRPRVLVLRVLVFSGGLET